MSTVTSTTSSSGIDLSAILQAATGSTSQGIDVNAAVTAAITAARAPEVQWQSQQTTLEGQESDLKTVSSAVSAIENDLSTLNSFTGAFSSLTVTSSNSSVSAYTKLGAATGSHVVNVSHLATTSSWYSSSSVANSSTGLSAGSFTLQLGTGTPAQITITKGETLDQLASAITNQSSLGVTASVINDASGSRLAIVSNSSGLANNIAIADTSLQVAKAADGSSWNSASVSDANGLSSGSFSIQLGAGAATQITATAGESLTSLANDINGRSLGVTASVVSDGGGLSHLAIVNSSTNDASGMTVSNTSPQFTQGPPGTDAKLTVDGIPIQSASNTVSGVVTGMVFNLTSAANTDVTVSATANTSAITTAINQFVTDYNKAIGYVNTENTYSASNSTSQPLSGDSALAMLQNTLLGAGSYSDSSNSTISTLGSLGISMGNDGTLTVDSGTLNNAIQNNFSEVQNFFEGSSLNGFSSALNNQLQELTDAGNGAFTVELSNMQTSYNDLASQISDFETNYISSLQTRLTASYSAAEIGLQSVSINKQQLDTLLGNNSSGN